MKQVSQAKELIVGLSRLVEVGRTLSSDSESKVRAALAALQDLLAKLGSSTVEAGDLHINAVIDGASRLLEAEMSHDDVRAAINRALMAQTNQLQSVYIREVYDDYVVYSLCSYDGGGEYQLYKAGYTVGTDGSATLGKAEPVAVETNYVAVSEAARDEPSALPDERVSLVEKALRKDGTIPVKIIEPGWGSSGYYSTEILKRDGPKVFTKGTKMYWDHPTLQERQQRPERSLKDLAAELVSDAQYLEGGIGGPGLYADAKVFGPYKDSIEALAPHIGVSINAYGYHESGTVEGRTGSIVREIVPDKFNSVDFVTMAGAGGQVCQLFESARGQAHKPSGGNELDELEAQQLRESAQQANARAQTAEQELARLREGAVLREHRDLVAEVLNGTEGLPGITKERLTGMLADKPVIKDGALDRDAVKAAVTEAVKAEVEYLQKIGAGTKASASPIRGMGSSEGGQTVDTDAILAEAFKDMGHDESTAKRAAALR